MMKKITALLANTLMVCEMAQATALYTSGSYEFADDNNTQLIVKNFTYEEEITIEASYLVTEANVGENEKCAVYQIGNGTTSVKVNSKSSTAARVKSLTIQTKAKIADGAFADWSGLTTLKMETTEVNELGENALPSNLTKIIVPAGMIEEFATAENWSKYAAIMEDENGVTYTTAITTMGKEVSCIEIGVSGNEIRIAPKQEIAVYTITGSLEFKGSAESVRVKNKGLYIVKAGKMTEKVLVK